jgi:NitT/TauT family transport system substrate-binding protein
MKANRRRFITAAALAATALVTGCNKQSHTAADGRTILRVGYFPNITHAQALVGFHETNTKDKEGWFEKATGAKIEWVQFNAGPAAMESLQIGKIDLSYVGPNPVLNKYIRANTRDFRVLTGSARGGVALVIHKGSGLKTPADFRGKKIATPQLGNTQDVAARAWLMAGGLQITQTGGDAHVMPTINADQLSLFQRKQLDAVWTVEPWVSRLELESDGEILLRQDDTFITLLATSNGALKTKGELLKKFVAAHEELTKKITAEPAFAKPAINAALLKATTKGIPEKLLDHAWPRLKFTTAIDVKDFESAMKDAKAAGLLPEEAPLDKLFHKP